MGETMSIELSKAERELLIRVLEQALQETRVEIRRTSTPNVHDMLLTEEKTLGDLLGRIREIEST